MINIALHYFQNRKKFFYLNCASYYQTEFYIGSDSSVHDIYWLIDWLIVLCFGSSSRMFLSDVLSEVYIVWELDDNHHPSTRNIRHLSRFNRVYSSDILWGANNGVPLLYWIWPPVYLHIAKFCIFSRKLHDIFCIVCTVMLHKLHRTYIPH